MRAVRMLVTLLLVMPLVLPAGQAVAGLPETPHPRQMSVADGLPSNRINAVTEDRQGYLWIATSDGLARYDGIGYRIWRGEQGLRDSFIWSVHADARNRLWIGTGNAGLAVLDADRRGFRYYNQANSPAMGSDTVWSVASTRDGTIWFGTSNAGLHRLAADGAITRFMPRQDDPRSLPHAAVTSLVVAADGALWIGTKGGAARWTGKDFERVPASALNSTAVDALSVEADGTLWIGTPRGVSQRRPDGRFVSAPWREHGGETVFKVLHRDRKGVYWLDIPEGLGRIGDRRVLNVPLYSGTANGIVKPSWSAGYGDRSGGLWFASTANGLWYLPANWRLFSVLPRRADDDTSVANAHVRGIGASADGTMWLVGSGGALDRLDPESGRVEHRARDIGAGFVPVAVFEDSRRKVWIGYQDGLARFDPVDGSVRRWSHRDAVDAALSNEISTFAETGDGRLWMASDNGSVQARDLDGRVESTLLPGDGHGIVAGAAVDQLGLAPDGAVWLAGSQGLLMWNDGARRFEPVPGAPAARVYGYAMGANNTLWLARLGSLERYRWDGAGLARQLAIDSRDGLPLIAPSGLTVDAAGLVWLTSVRGLIRVDPAKRSVRLYGVRDGLPSQEFGEPPVPRPLDGRILAGSPEGLVLFDPAIVRPAPGVPELVIETIGARNREGRVDFATDRPFRVAHDDRDLRIVARLLSFNDANNNRYRFLLEGYDRGWVEVGADGERVFSQLEAGGYTLRVKARTADNVWSQVRVIRFRVASPWWWTWWAIAAWGLLAAAIAWWLLRSAQQRLRRKHAWQLARHRQELAEQASQAKTHFLATLGHEVRTPMTGVLGMSELLLDTDLDARQRSYTESIRRAGGHLMRLVNDALDLARIEAGRLELEQQAFDLHALIEDVTALMAPVARQHKLEFRVRSAADAPRWLHGDAMRVRQILLNLLGNAIKFTESGHVGLRIEAGEGGGVRFIVSDTGPGLNDEQKQRLFRRFEQAEGARTSARYGGSGLGLAICQELAAAMDGRITVDSAPGEGARFTVDLPLTAAAAMPDAKPAHRDAVVRSLSLLLVEDDPTVAEVITGLLRAQGHRVVHAAHGLSALAELSGTAFDVALLDLDLPGIDGLALARQLRVQGFTQPLIAVTARADAEAEPLSREAGFDGFLRKPLTGEMLAEAIEAVLPRDQVEG
jgi:signal transduction histidine kinase/CheY-like chemotaxis protein/sugar lactone lactonase YvrE